MVTSLMDFQSEW